MPHNHTKCAEQISITELWLALRHSAAANIGSRFRLTEKGGLPLLDDCLPRLAVAGDHVRRRAGVVERLDVGDTLQAQLT